MEGIFFGFATGVYYHVVGGRFEMGPVGVGIAVLAGGLLGALGGGVAAASADRIRWWFPVALSAAFSALTVFTEAERIGNLMTMLLCYACFVAAGALVGLLVALSGVGIARLLRVDGVSRIQEHRET